MGTRQIFDALQQAGLNLSLVGDTLRVVPREAITPEARAMIREHKAALVELLRQGEANAPDPTPATSAPPAATTPHLEEWETGTISDGPEVSSLAGQTIPTDEESYEERAAIIEHAGNLPRLWAEGLATLLIMRPPEDIPLKKWRAIQEGTLRFADRWAVQAHALGWSVQEIFGCHRSAPITRVDCMGLLLAMSGNGVELSELTHNTAIFLVGRNRATQRLRRGEIFTREQRMLWEEPPEGTG